MRTLVFFAAVLALSGCKAPPDKPQKPSKTRAKANDWKKAFQHQVQYDPVQKAVVVDVQIQPGYHAYTTGETIGKPMELTLDETSARLLAEPVRYPKGKTKNLKIGRSVIVEGKTKIIAPTKAKLEGSQGPITGKFRYQVCTDEACDRPRTTKFVVGPG